MKNKNMKKILVLMISLVVIGLAVASCGGSSDKKESKSKAETVDIKLFDTPAGTMHIEPATITVKSGTDVVFNVTNDGTMVHNLTIEGGKSTADLARYAAATLDAGKVTKDFVIFCSIPGHREAGMEAKVTVD